MKTSEMLRKLIGKKIKLNNIMVNVALKIKDATKNNGFIYSGDYKCERDKLDLDIMRRLGLESQLDSISNIHGKVFIANNVKIIPLYHPAVAVYNRQMMEALKEDFKVLKDIVGEV